jgi:hypothetical protein
LDKQPEYDAAPEQVTPEKEAEVHEKTGSKEALVRFRRKDHLERTKDKH